MDIKPSKIVHDIIRNECIESNRNRVKGDSMYISRYVPVLLGYGTYGSSRPKMEMMIAICAADRMRAVWAGGRSGRYE